MPLTVMKIAAKCFSIHVDETCNAVISILMDILIFFSSLEVQTSLKKSRKLSYN